MGKRDLAILIGLGLVGTALASLLGRAPATPQQPDGTTRRIVVASPAVCEIVYQLGCGDRVVGVSDYCVYPPEATRVARIGGYANPNRERIMALDVDLVITQGKHDLLEQLCHDQGIRFFSVEIESLEDIRRAMQTLGDLLEVPDRAAREVARMDAALEVIRNAAPQGHRPTVFMTLTRQPGKITGLMTPGSGTFLSDVVEVAGGRNVFHDAVGNWPTPSKEALVARKPDIILELYPETVSPEQAERLRADWKEMPELPAVRNGRIYYLGGDYVLLPGPRAVQTAFEMVLLFRGEVHHE